MDEIAVLHLEDDPLDAELIEASLQASGIVCRITRVDSREAFLDALGAGSYHLILADYSLPGFDGVRALDELRDLGIHTPFIFISGALGEDLAIESLKRGATDYVLKHRLARLAPAVNRALREAQERIELSKAELERERLVSQLAVAYEREHRIAETLQRSFLREVEEGRFPGLELGTIYQAAWDEAQVGGDYYDYFALEDGKVALIVGDVSGKGLKAAERTAELKYTLRAYLREDPDAAAGMHRLNAFLCRSSLLDPDPQEFFVCIMLAIVDPVARSASVSVAGSEPPLILREDGRFECVKARGLPLGIVATAEYGVDVVTLGPSDLLFLTTDGITEARKGRDELGYDGLIRMAADAARRHPSLDRIGRSILEAAQAFAGGKLQDDACLLLARIRP